MSKFNFGLASVNEQIVFGAERPGHNSKQVGVNSINEWISFMKNKGIKRVCCLLPDWQLKFYGPEHFLLDTYRKEFGQDNVCSAKIEDYQLCDISLLNDTILPFLRTSDAKREKVVVHCSGGIGRTGRILAAWLVNKHKVSPEEAIVIIGSQKAVLRDPCEGVEPDDLLKQLAECRIDEEIIMDDDSLTEDGCKREIFNSVNTMTIIKLNTGYRIEFEPSQQSLDLTDAKSFYCRIHYTVEMQKIDFRPEARLLELYLQLKFNSLYHVEITFGEDTCYGGVGFPRVEYPTVDE